jgi:hypothetical protein
MRLAVGLLTVLLTACGGLGGRTGTPLAGPSMSPSPEDGAPVPGAIRFVLQTSYQVGDRVVVKIVNQGSHPYQYNSTGYEACNLTYRDQGGREFIIPPGTHCDLVLMEDIVPGESATLFKWHLDECVKDRWGCVKEAPLEPGIYTIEGRFRSSDGSPPAHAEATFEVVSRS